MFDRDARCLLSHPALTPHNLSFRCRPVIQRGCFTCGGKYTVREHDFFHNDCHKRPRRITHPYHLQHPLTLFYRDPETRTVSNIIPDASPSEPDRFGEEPDTSDQGRYQFVDIVPSISDIIFDKCTWCGKCFQGDWFYRCLICSFCLDLPCAERLPPLTVANPKGHHHSLLFLPRPLLVPCDACGLVDVREPSYACFQCNYMAHQSCFDLPRVIKITRHPHRLHYIPYRSPLSFSCRICYKDVDIKYGQYSCNQEDCSYVVHSRCATHVNVWDGTDLEWQPEDSNEEDIASFKNLGNGVIDHFGHEHLLELKKHYGVGDTDKQCDACVFPIVSPQLFYHCERCDYSLHEVCAGLPRKLDHALHNHTLFLDPSPPNNYSYMTCSVCFRASTGFRYRCSKEGCSLFSADVRCISVKECYIHKSHYDKHPLTLSYGEEKSSSADDVYWCEVCEKLLDPKEWFYTCDECCTTVHLQCSIYYEGYNEICKTKYSYYKGWTSRVPICSWYCLTERRW
ncbi:hypothetical protein N665_1116s0001 [Sinapis alba]|nr:hypothetical protein N665_1116s0001 [Sinapis alba]